MSPLAPLAARRYQIECVAVEQGADKESDKFRQRKFLTLAVVILAIGLASTHLVL